MKYIIDGYNVIHRIDKLKGKRLRSQREGLIRILEIAQVENRRFKDLTVVFDGQGNVLAPPVHSTIRVIFTRGKSADRKIKQILESSTFSRDIGVVSDDREVKYYTNLVGARKISVNEFLKMLSASAKRKDSFKLDEQEMKKINQELEELWLKNRRER